MNKEKFMKIALEEAYSGINNSEGGPFGACLVIGSEVIARAHNTVIKDNDPTAHAEVNAIRQASQKLKNYNLEDAVIFSTTEPCPMCFAASHWAKIKKIYYGTKIEDVKELGFNELSISNEEMKTKGNSPVVFEGSVLLEECEKLLKDFQKLEEKKLY
jgi:guanine deaminase